MSGYRTRAAAAGRTVFFHVCSDDPKWCAQQPFFQGKDVKVVDTDGAMKWHDFTGPAVARRVPCKKKPELGLPGGLEVHNQ